MATLASLIIARASTIANDAAKVTWPQSEWLDWLNEGQLALVMLKSDAYTKTTTHQLAPGAKQTAPAGCINIVDVRQNNSGQAITACDRSSLDRFQPNWMNAPISNTVKHWMDDQQPDTFYVYPAQGTSPASVVITHSSEPPVVAYTDPITVREIYAPNLVNYLLYRAYSKDSEGGHEARAAAAYKLFSEG